MGAGTISSRLELTSVFALLARMREDREARQQQQDTPSARHVPVQQQTGRLWVIAAVLFLDPRGERRDAAHVDAVHAAEIPNETATTANGCGARGC